MHLGLFGGTFDPPHIGHLIVAEVLREAFRLDKVLWMVAATPPHKQDRRVTDAESRLALVEAAIAGNPHFEASRLELDREGPSYTVDTLRRLHGLYPEAKWSLLVGADSLAGFPSWREPAEIARLADLVVYQRAGHPAPSVLGGMAVRFADAGRVDVSSSEIRARLAAGRSVRYLVPEAVLRRIEAGGLYREA